MISGKNWAIPGVECICTRDVWYTNLLLLIFGSERPIPTFMQVYKVSAVTLNELDDAEHQVKIQLYEIPGHWYCTCSFQPLEKLKDESSTTTKVDDRLTTKHPSPVS